MLWNDDAKDLLLKEKAKGTAEANKRAYNSFKKFASTLPKTGHMKQLSFIEFCLKPNATISKYMEQWIIWYRSTNSTCTNGTIY